MSDRYIPLKDSDIDSALLKKRIAELEAQVETLEEGLSASEALYGFMGWLTTRSCSVVFGAAHDAAIAADLVSVFCDVNNLDAPRDGWHEHLTHPEIEAGGD